MQLDYTQLKLKFESITGLRPMPYSEFVESYVKAYYIPENTLREWIECHKPVLPKECISKVCKPEYIQYVYDGSDHKSDDRPDYRPEKNVE
ncbi:hypothetical protein G9C98_005475 [Cotesia typhae]|uniref:Syndetin C-terminal domain-containing protein n=1 Tax=Cotesia typhae TaxID=2053667 RepID=A0A8J5QNL3_9HYME|nr:hypothetical protein G9C98_005475 [Cotesia typhae]